MDTFLSQPPPPKPPPISLLAPQRITYRPKSIDTYILSKIVDMICRMGQTVAFDFFFMQSVTATVNMIVFDNN